ncbi:MAG: Mov34/MPN/PAD-1 family protein [Candidatus Babeliaceae bacterium]|nr:Mov34/MPN/PAD-1 family protein [Candidatus Babeliaceae bacterium]
MKNHRSRKCVPEITIHRQVISKLFASIGSRPPESGGVLLGPVNCNEVSDFYFDDQGQCSGATYSPDYKKIGYLLKHDWADDGLEMKGIIHSHPNRFDRLSGGDLSYIARLLQCNPQDKFFFAPIVIVEEFRFVPWLVLRSQCDSPVVANLKVI